MFETIKAYSLAVRKVSPPKGDNMKVLSKDELTGEVVFRDIVAHYSNEYEITVHIDV